MSKNKIEVPNNEEDSDDKINLLALYLICRDVAEGFSDGDSVNLSDLATTSNRKKTKRSLHFGQT